MGNLRVSCPDLQPKQHQQIQHRLVLFNVALMFQCLGLAPGHGRRADLRVDPHLAVKTHGCHAPKRYLHMTSGNKINK